MVMYTQEAQKRQPVDAAGNSSVPPVDSRQLEQLKAALMQQIQQQQRQRDVIHDDRRLPTDRLPTEFDLRERQRQEEIRRRQVNIVLLMATLTNVALEPRFSNFFDYGPLFSLGVVGGPPHL